MHRSDGVAATNIVYAEALASKYVIGYYTAAASGVNTGVSSGWSTTPSLYYGGNDDGNGDYTIGMSFYDASLANGESATFTYYYIFGSDIAAAVQAVSSASTLSVLNSSSLSGNSPAYAAAEVIDNSPDLLQLFTDANFSTDKDISDAASQILPLLTGGSTIALRNTLAGINHVIQTRMGHNRGMSSGDMTIEVENFWLKPFGTWIKQDDRDGVSGVKSDSAGLMLGVDAEFNGLSRLGLALAYAKSDIVSNSTNAPQSLDVTTYQLIGYARKNLAENSEMNFQLDFGVNSNSGNRTITFTNSAANADYDSYSAHLSAGVAHIYQITPRNSVKASFQTDYTRIKDKGYTETGAGLLNLTVSDRSAVQWLVGIGGELHHELNKSTALNLNLGLGYDLKNEQAVITAVFAGSPGASFTTHGLDPSPWIMTSGAGISRTIKEGVDLSANYDMEYRDDFLAHSASLKLSWAF